jgi:hypothetical protein
MRMEMHRVTGKYVITILTLIIFSSILFAQKSDVCLECHSDPDITTERKGKTVSLTVKKYLLAKSVHGKLECINCHVGFDAEAVPHKEPMTQVNCMNCHSDAPAKHLFHHAMVKPKPGTNQSYYNCKSCHGNHEVSSYKTAFSKTHFTNSTIFCGTCHKQEKAEHLKSQHYVELNKSNPNAPTCIYCHSKPITRTSESNLAKLKFNQEQLCLSCHLNDPNNQSKYAKTLVNYSSSVHGAAIAKGNKNAAVCIDCHTAHNLQKAESQNSNISQSHIPQVCGKCHISINQEYESSTHGVALKKGIKDAPGCTYCHGEHNIKPLPDVPPRTFEDTHIKHTTIVRNKMVYCIVCHADEKMMRKYNISTVAEAHDWLPNQSRHWETVRCVDCHSSYDPPNLSHNILPPDKTVKKCEECHSQNSLLMSKLYKHEKVKSREKYGFINGTILSDAYVIGTTRNVLLDVLSVTVFGLTILGVSIHGLLRWYFRKKPVAVTTKTEKEENKDNS